MGKVRGKCRGCDFFKERGDCSSSSSKGIKSGAVAGQ